MTMMDTAMELSKAQTRAASEASRAMNVCVAAMLEASSAFAKTSAERNMALAATITSAQSIDAAAAIYGAFARDSMRAAGVMTAKIADACTAAAKHCGELATQAMENAAASAAPSLKSD